MIEFAGSQPRNYRWYVAQALAGLEATAIHHLSREGITAYSPADADHKARRFPGYVFVELESPDEAGIVNRTRGIHKVLPIHCKTPLALPHGFVDDLREDIARGADDRSVDSVIRKYASGDDVQITAGSFAGFCGEMVRYSKGSMIVLLMLFGQKREITIPIALAA